MLNHLSIGAAVELFSAAILTILPVILVGFFPRSCISAVSRLPSALRLTLPGLLCLPYVLVVHALGGLQVRWLLLYCFLPIVVALILSRVEEADGNHESTLGDFLVVAVLGLAVDLRWFERAWPPHMAIFNKILLFDAGIYGFQVIRKLTQVGFDLRLRWRDISTGLRYFGWYAPIAIALGLVLGFLHIHVLWPGMAKVSVAYAFTFSFIAIPEELFFRGWLQNLLERRMGRIPSLVVTAVIFGLSHFNKRAAHFNWRYVLLAGIAGIFYGLAWRRDRRIGASVITHACVDTVWSQWLR